MTLMTPRASTPVGAPAPKPTGLSIGDRLTAVDFERRPDTMTGVNNAQLVEGIDYVPSPARLEEHDWPHAVFPGLWLDGPAMTARDTAFVQRLSTKP